MLPLIDLEGKPIAVQIVAALWLAASPFILAGLYLLAMRVLCGKVR